jgi:hypothetical protein
MLEIATGTSLPEAGKAWHDLREGELPALSPAYSEELSGFIGQVGAQHAALELTCDEIWLLTLNSVHGSQCEDDASRSHKATQRRSHPEERSCTGGHGARYANYRGTYSCFHQDRAPR